MSDYNDGLLPEPCLRMDTHFGDEYESVEFGDGTGYVKAAPTLARLGALHVELDELRDENARLRSELESVGAAAYLYGRGDLKAENAKLRELCKRFAEYVSQDKCEGCVCKSRCNDGEIDECWQRTEIREAAHEFGIEVD